jgi:Tfp pilus assembly protein PilO
MAVSTAPRITVPKLPRREKSGVPRSQAERLWLIAGGLVAFILFLIGYFFFISPQRSDTADVNSQVATTQAQNALLQNRIDALREQNKDLAKYESELAEARLALPAVSGVSDFLRTLQSLGNATLTDVTSLSVGTPSDVSAVAGAAPSTAPSAGASAPSGDAVAAPNSGSASPIYALPISATVTGSPAALEKFLDQLQAVQPRAVLITEITQGSAAPGGSLPNQAAAKTSLRLTMQAFVAPSTPSESASLSAASH